LFWKANNEELYARRSSVKKHNAEAIAGKFNNLSFHDDNLTSVTVHTLQSRRNRTRIDIRLRDDSTDKEKLLSFLGCANIRYVMDFDVLADNWYAQTNASIAKSDAVQMKKFVHSHSAHWHVRYMPPIPQDKPVRKKLAEIGKYVLFKLMLFGGTIEILARNCKLSHKR
jgi:hypothetical protein